MPYSIPFGCANPGIVIGKKWTGIKKIQEEFCVTVKVREDHFEVTGQFQETLVGACSYIKDRLAISLKDIIRKREEEEEQAKQKVIIQYKVEHEGYCMYHQCSDCRCIKDADGRVKHGYTYPFEKMCGTHDSLKCQCPRLPSGEMIVKATETAYAHGPPIKYCDDHKTWHCACKRDKYGTVMSKKHGYPIEKYCSLHNAPDCSCY
jgi:hypothetical protein